jgi:hypothetical protein
MNDTKPLLMCRGQFFVLGETLTVHLIPESRLSTYYDAMGLADSARDPEASRAYVIRQTFHVEAHQALPAFDLEAVTFYMDHYEGPHEKAIRLLAACILAGVPFQDARDTDQGGAPARIPERPIRPSGPTTAKPELVTLTA